MRDQHRTSRTWSIVAAVAAVLIVGIAPRPASARSRCHAGGFVLARQNGVVLWSVRRSSRTRLYLCARSRGRAQLLASGGGNLYPGVSRLQVAGNFAAFVLTTSFSENENLVVFDFRHGRRELTHFLGCFGSRACAFAAADQLTQYALAANGWVAEVWRLGSAFGQTPSPYVTGDRAMVATNDGVNFYSIDFGLNFSPLATSGTALAWTSDLGGASSVELGSAVVPQGAPQSLLPCQVLTARDVAPVLGESSSSSQQGRCTYTSRSSPARALTVKAIGLAPAEPTADESFLRSSGWDAKMSDAGGFRGYQNRTSADGVIHQQLIAFQGAVELSLDLRAPGRNAGEQLAWLSHVAFDRLFAIPVRRTA